MADLKISELSELAGGDLVAADELAIVDDSASETKKIGVANLIENGVTLISDDAIPGAKILFAAGDIVTADLADDAVTTAKVADNAITAAHLADESTVDLVTELPASGAFTGQLALDTDDNKLYLWDGSSWVSPQAGVSDVDGSTTGIVNIVSTVSGDTVTISATLDDTTAAAQFLAGPVASSGAVGYRAIDGGDLPVATTTSKGAVIVNGNGLQMNGDSIEIANTVSASSVRHLVTYDANGLVTGGAAIAAGDLPLATTTTAGGVIVGDGLGVNASGVISVDNTVTAGEYTKVTVTERGLVSSGGTLDADDIPDHSATKLTSGTIGSSLIATDAITAAKLADQSTTKFGGALGSDNVTIFPAGDFKGQFFYDETTQDLYIYTGSAFVPITVLSGNLVNAGAYDASTNQMSAVTSAGSSAGFAVGNALPAPAKTNLNHYVVVDTSGTGTGAAPAVALAPPDMLLSQGVGTEYSLIDVSNAIAGQTASNISLIATGNVIATNVQSAITELDTEKLPKAGGNMSGNLKLNNANIVFEGSTIDDYETTLTATDPTADRTITLPDVTGTVVTTGDTGSVTSTMISNGTIVNADISGSAEIAVSKLANGSARQLLQTDAAGTGVEFASNIDIPGTLDVTGEAVFDTNTTISGILYPDTVDLPDGTASAPTLRFDNDTGLYSPGDNNIAITTQGTERLRVDSVGDVGIGLDPNSVTARLQVRGSTSSAIRLDRASEDQISFIEIAADRTTSDTYLGGIKFEWDGTEVARLSAKSGSDTTDKDNGKLLFETATSGSSVTERMRIDSSGRLLIGTTSVGSTAADNLIVGDSGNCGITLRSGNTSDCNIFFSDGTTGNENYRGRVAYDHNADEMRFDTAATRAVTIDSSGNVGIGLDSPGQRLVVASASNTILRIDNADDSTAKLYFHNSGSTDMDISVTSAEMSFNSGSNERMRIDSSGRLLIGVSTAFDTSTASMLQIQSASGTAPRFSLMRNDTAVVNDDLLGRINVFTKDDSVKLECGRIDFTASQSHSSTDRGTDFSVFTTKNGENSTEARFKVDHNGIMRSFGDGTAAAFFRTTRTAGSDNAIVLNNNATDVSSGGTTVFQVKADGDVENANNAYTAISDVKLKENIVDAESQWDDFKAVRFRKYNFKEETGFGTHTQLGVIAQEIEQTSPGLVKTSPDLDDEGNDLGTATKSVKYSVLTQKALVALQEAMKRIETLEAKVAALEAGN